MVTFHSYASHSQRVHGMNLMLEMQQMPKPTKLSHCGSRSQMIKGKYGDHHVYKKNTWGMSQTPVCHIDLEGWTSIIEKNIWWKLLWPLTPPGYPSRCTSLGSLGHSKGSSWSSMPTYWEVRRLGKPLPGPPKSGAWAGWVDLEICWSWLSGRVDQLRCFMSWSSWSGFPAWLDVYDLLLDGAIWC